MRERGRDEGEGERGVEGEMRERGREEGEMRERGRDEGEGGR